MKKVFVLLLAAVVLMTTGCIKITINTGNGESTSTGSSGGESWATTESSGAADGEGMDFKYMELRETSMMAGAMVYRAERTPDGVHLEYYYSYSYWDSEKEEGVDAKQMIHEVYGDEELYRHLARIAENSNIRKWDGFSKSDPNVLDGYGFSFEAELEDGTEIYAHGSNAYPDGYGLLQGELDSLTSREVISKTEFEMPGFTLELPESWVGNVTAQYRDGYVAFTLENSDTATIAIIYKEIYEYSYEDLISLGTYTDEYGNTVYVSIRKYGDSDSDKKKESMTEEQRAICGSVDEDIKTIAESVKFK